MNEQKAMNVPYKFDSLSDLHRMLGLPKPMHPLVSLLNNMDGGFTSGNNLPNPFILSFYKVSYVFNVMGRFKYGQHFYDFDEGGLFFLSPNQLTGSDGNTTTHSGFTLLIHPDFFLTYPLARKIKQYGFFSYSVNEALHLSDSEKRTIVSVFDAIESELTSRIDEMSQDVLISQIELLLTYANRFYKRQFITRKAVNHDLLQKFEALLADYFNNTKVSNPGIPTVHQLSDALNVSPGYLSDMLRSLTGQSAQQHIHDKLIDRAKEKLTTTNLSVSEVAYELGFEHPASFSRLFKARTNRSPLAFRQSFS